MRTCVGSSGVSGGNLAIDGDSHAMQSRHKTLITTGFIIYLVIICDGRGKPGQAKEIGARSNSPRIVNIINFIRQCEPRIDWITEDVLYETVVEQVNILKKHRLKGTFLLQYDALMDTRYQTLLKGLPAPISNISAGNPFSSV